MADKNVKVDYMGKMLDGVEVSIDESTERWSEIKLSDGSLIRAKIGLVGATRVAGEYDQDGNPAYVFKMAPTVVVGESPSALRKKK